MRSNFPQSILMALLALCVFAAESQAINITEGDVRVRRLDSFGFTGTNGSLTMDGGGGNDELYEMFAYIGNANGVVRVDAANFDIVSTITATANVATSKISLSGSGAAVLGLSSGDIEIDYTFTLTDDTGPLDADAFSWNADITNMTTAALDLVFYSYLDLDLAGAGDFGDDIATANAYRIMVRDPDDPDAFMWESVGGPADHFQVGSYPGLRNTLDGMTAATDLSDTSVLFGPADFSAAFQNDLMNLAAGGTRSVGYQVVATPEPNTALLMAIGLVGLTIQGRKRRPAPPKKQC